MESFTLVYVRVDGREAKPWEQHLGCEERIYMRNIKGMHLTQLGNIEMIDVGLESINLLF